MALQSKSIVMEEQTVVIPIRKPLFLKFAEYLGYETPLIGWVDKFCDGKDIPSCILSALNIDAVVIFNKMLTEYTKDEIKMWWDRFYPVVIAEAEFKILTKESDVPY